MRRIRSKLFCIISLTRHCWSFRRSNLFYRTDKFSERFELLLNRVRWAFGLKLVIPDLHTDFRRFHLFPQIIYVVILADIQIPCQ